MSNRLAMPWLLWRRMIRDIAARGGGQRESGAFLLGCRRRGMVHGYALYDDLEPTALDTGIVVITAIGFARLWETCRALGLEVLADAHTHGGPRPTQSATDRVNPMIAEKGHMALILPNFGRFAWWDLSDIALYRYEGSYQWSDFRRDRRSHFGLVLW